MADEITLTAAWSFGETFSKEAASEKPQKVYSRKSRIRVYWVIVIFFLFSWISLILYNKSIFYRRSSPGDAAE